MRYFKVSNSGYLLGVGIGNGGEEIAECEYKEITEIIHGKPVAPDGYCYRLKNDLTWEQHELSASTSDPELTAKEALNIIVGVDRMRRSEALNYRKCIEMATEAEEILAGEGS